MDFATVQQIGQGAPDHFADAQLALGRAFARRGTVV
jgi:hypothetical protein